MSNLPFVHLHCDRGHLVSAFVNPKISTATQRGSDNDNFRKHLLIPLNEDGSIIDLGWSSTPDGHILDNQESITCSDFLHRIKGDSWKYVAIRNSEGKFISCRRATNIPTVCATSLTTYSTRIGKFEIFQMDSDPCTGCFTFKSHNNYYLQPNFTFNTTRCRPSKFLWKVSPLLEGFKERVEFVGVSRHGTSNTSTAEAAEFVMKKTASINGRIREAYINPIEEVMYNYLQAGQSHAFQGELTDGSHLWHYFLRGDEDELYMVVTTENFSSAYATDFTRELPNIYNRYVADCKVRNADSGKRDFSCVKPGAHGKDAGKMIGQLRNLMLHYNTENQKYVPKELRELKMLMEQNISNMRDNLDDAETIRKTSEDLLEQALVFKKRAADLKTDLKNRMKRRRRRIVLAAAAGITVCSAGAIIAASKTGIATCGLGAFATIDTDTAATATAAGLEAGALNAGITGMHPLLWYLETEYGEEMMEYWEHVPSWSNIWEYWGWGETMA